MDMRRQIIASLVLGAFFAGLLALMVFRAGISDGNWNPLRLGGTPSLLDSEEKRLDPPKWHLIIAPRHAIGQIRPDKLWVTEPEQWLSPKERLLNFHISEIEFNNASLDEALDSLAFLVNQGRRPREHALAFDIDESVPQELMTAPWITFRLEDTTAWGVLHLLVAQCVLDWSETDKNLLLFSISEPDALVSTSVEVSTDFVDSVGESDTAIKEWLKRWGVPTGAFESFAYASDSGAVSMEGRHCTLVCLEHLLSALTDPPLQLSITPRLIVMNEDFDANRIVDAKVPEDAVANSPYPPFHFETSTVPNQTHHTISRVSHPRSARFTGLRVDLNPVLEGNLIRLDGRIELGVPPDWDPVSDSLTPSLANSRIHRADFSTVLRNGDAVALRPLDPTHPAYLKTVLFLTLKTVLPE